MGQPALDLLEVLLEMLAAYLAAELALFLGFLPLRSGPLSIVRGPLGYVVLAHAKPPVYFSHVAPGVLLQLVLVGPFYQRLDAWREIELASALQLNSLPNLLFRLLFCPRYTEAWHG